MIEVIEINKLFLEVMNNIKEINIPISTNIVPMIFIDNERYDRVGACYQYESIDVYEIHLSSDVLKANQSEIKNIIAHEILHTCYNSMEHDGVWDIYKNRVNNLLGYDIKTVYSWKKLLVND